MSRENKTHRPTMYQMSLPDGSLSDRFLDFTPHTKSHPFCVCTPRAILEYEEGKPTTVCTDMPWLCPFKPNA